MKQVEFDLVVAEQTALGEHPAPVAQAHAQAEVLFGSEIARLLAEVTKPTDDAATKGLSVLTEINSKR